MSTQTAPRKGAIVARGLALASVTATLVGATGAFGFTTAVADESPSISAQGLISEVTAAGETAGASALEGAGTDSAGRPSPSSTRQTPHPRSCSTPSTTAMPPVRTSKSSNLTGRSPHIRPTTLSAARVSAMKPAQVDTPAQQVSQHGRKRALQPSSPLGTACLTRRTARASTAQTRSRKPPRATLAATGTRSVIRSAPHPSSSTAAPATRPGRTEQWTHWTSPP